MGETPCRCECCRLNAGSRPALRVLLSVGTALGWVARVVWVLCLAAGHHD